MPNTSRQKRQAVQPTQTEDLDTLRRQATTLAAQAEVLTEAYRRATWVRFALVFFPIPFVVVLLRLDLDAWHYYLAGGGYLAFSALLYTYDSRASDKCNEAVRAAGLAQQAYELASHPSRRAPP
jgi:hypothetical protein